MYIGRPNNKTMNALAAISTGGIEKTDLQNRTGRETSCNVEHQLSVPFVLIVGDEVKVIYNYGTDTTPLGSESAGIYNGFNGFKI